MKILYNGEALETGANNLSELLHELNLTGQAVATAVNGDFVPRSLRGQTPLHEQDRIEVVAPMQGG
ncbi:MAG: sulfur carrier protein ThiS [Nitrincola lacisaponensis]|uniref:sulfur carrier protein ThiS n=1 Tax=Nitrincola lacisaponensis TaxID=267850 RepID=UPI00391A4EF2